MRSSTTFRRMFENFFLLQGTWGVCVCVCVSKKERQREKERARAHERERAKERTRARESATVRARTRARARARERTKVKTRASARARAKEKARKRGRKISYFFFKIEGGGPCVRPTCRWYGCRIMCTNSCVTWFPATRAALTYKHVARRVRFMCVCTAVMCMCVCVCVCVCGAEVCARTHVSGYLVMSRISMIHMTMLQRFVGHHLHEHDAT